MDFLPLPDNPEEHPPVVEMFGVPYDNRGFEGYDVRQGWNTWQLRRGDIRGARNDWNEYSQICLAEYGDAVHSFTGEDLVQTLVAPFIQNWITGGLFHMALGRQISRDDMTCREDQTTGQARRTLSLKGLFQELFARRAAPGQSNHWLQEFARYLDEASWVLMDLDALHEGLGAPVIPGPLAVLLSSLVSTLHDYAVIWYHPRMKSASATSRVRWLEHQLSDKGWCPERVQRLRTELGTDGLYYASLLRYSDDSKSHRNCSESVCIAYNVENYDKYVQTHSPAYCACVDPACEHTDSACACKILYNTKQVQDNVTALVTRGSIPLLTACHDEHGTSLKVIEAREGVHYVAISHVWSDGMGNPHQNSLKPCLIRFLHGCVRQVLQRVSPGGEPRFWLDTICVPVEPKDIRSAAIENMRRVYAEASAVLVISHDFLRQPLPTTPHETIVRICQSKWLKRLWTMQEGVLAKSLFFQFNDQAIEYSELDDQLHEMMLSTSEVSCLVGSRANLTVSNLISMEVSDATRESFFESFWFNVRHRSTSRPSDQAVCAAILCGLDLKLILAAGDDDKMKVFWRTCHNVPLGILWANGPRFTGETMRWAPQSFLHPSTWAVPPPKTGLLATVMGDDLHFSGVNSFYFGFVELPKREDALVEFTTTNYSETYVILLTKRVGNPTWSSLRPFQDSIYLLWHRLPAPDGFSPGVLVFAEEKRATEDNARSDTAMGILRARWLAQVNVFTKTGNWAEYIHSFPTRYDDEGSPIPSQSFDVVGQTQAVRNVTEQQEWCIY